MATRFYLSRSLPQNEILATREKINLVGSLYEFILDTGYSKPSEGQNI